jgi:hypothetical protein
MAQPEPRGATERHGGVEVAVGGDVAGGLHDGLLHRANAVRRVRFRVPPCPVTNQSGGDDTSQRST